MLKVLLVIGSIARAVPSIVKLYFHIRKEIRRVRAESYKPKLKEAAKRAAKTGDTSELESLSNDLSQL